MILYIACLLQLLFVFSGASPHDLTTGSITEASTLTLKNAVDEKGLCKVNGSFPLDCNTCICVIGSHPACTLMGCISLVPTPPGDTCKPGDKWKVDDCNFCVCNNTGQANCSTTDCSTQTKVRPKRSNDKLNAGGKCKPGDKWKLDECNDCVCTHTGYASCTLNDCSPAKGSNKGRPKRSGGSSDKLSAGGKCKPGDKWKLDECNDCVCTHTGYASCTLNDCSPAKGSNKGRPKRSGGSSDKLSAGGKCKPGDKWKLDECNNCVCTHTGYASCTLNDCSPAKGSGKGRSKRSGESSGKLQPGGKCKPGDKWDLDECNKCVCTHTGYASCSLNDCGKGKGRGKRSSDGSRRTDLF